MAINATTAANYSLIDGVFGNHPEITNSARDLMKLAADPAHIITPSMIERIRDIITGKAEGRKPYSVAEACALTGLTAQALNYHARKGRIHRAYISGARRALGYVADDIDNIIKGRV